MGAADRKKNDAVSKKAATGLRLLVLRKKNPTTMLYALSLNKQAGITDVSGSIINFPSQLKQLILSQFFG